MNQFYVEVYRHKRSGKIYQTNVRETLGFPGKVIAFNGSGLYETLFIWMIKPKQPAV